MIYKKLISISFLLALTACNEEEVDLHFADGDIPYEIVVQGGVCSVMGKQLVYISKPMSVNDTIAIPVSNATVEVSDGQNTYLYRETEQKGEYESVEEFAGEVGKVYTLKIEYCGQTYFASDSMVAATEIELEQIPAGEQTKYMKIEHWRDGEVVFYDFVSIDLSKHKFGCVETAKWVFRDDSMFVKTPKNIVFAEKYYSHEQSIPQGVFPMATWGSGVSYNEERANSPVQCLKMSMSDRYYDYLISTFNLTDWSGGMFSTIPGNVKTNLSKGGAGYFYASDVKIRYLDLHEMLELVEMFGDKELSDEYDEEDEE